MGVGAVDVDGAPLEADGFDAGQVAGAGALVVKGHAAVALEVAHPVRYAGRVDGELLVVHADTVAVRVRVGEEARLEHGVGRGLDAGRHMGRVEGDLLDFGKVILYVFVEEEFADLAQRELLLWPDVGQVEDVDLLLGP